MGKKEMFDDGEEGPVGKALEKALDWIVMGIGILTVFYIVIFVFFW